MAFVFRIKLCCQRPGDHFPTDSGLGTSISSYLHGSLWSSVCESLLTPPPSPKQWERSVGDVEVRGRRGAQRSEAAVINPALPLGCRGCGCHSKRDEKHSTIFSLKGENPDCLKEVSIRKTDAMCAALCIFPSLYPSVSWFILIMHWRVNKCSEGNYYTATKSYCRQWRRFLQNTLWRFVSGFCSIQYVHVFVCTDAQAPLTFRWQAAQYLYKWR